MCTPVLYQTSAALPTDAPLVARAPAFIDPIASALIIQGTGVSGSVFASGIAVGRDYAGADILDTLADGTPGAIRTQIFTNFSQERTVKVTATIFEKDDSFPPGFNPAAPAYRGDIEFESESFTGLFPYDVEDQAATDVIVPIDLTGEAIKRGATYIVGIVAEVPGFNLTQDSSWGLLSVKPVTAGDPSLAITVRNFAPGTTVTFFDASLCIAGCDVPAAVAETPPTNPGETGESFFNSTVSIELISKCQPPSAPPPSPEPVR